MSSETNKPTRDIPAELTKGRSILVISFFKTLADSLYFLWYDFTKGLIKFPSYTVSNLPDAQKNIRRVIYVSDETGGATLAFSDGTNWRRVQDRAIVS